MITYNIVPLKNKTSNLSILQKLKYSSQILNDPYKTQDSGDNEENKKNVSITDDQNETTFFLNKVEKPETITMKDFLTLANGWWYRKSSVLNQEIKELVELQTKIGNLFIRSNYQYTIKPIKKKQKDCLTINDQHLVVFPGLGEIDQNSLGFCRRIAENDFYAPFEIVFSLLGGRKVFSEDEKLKNVFIEKFSLPKMYRFYIIKTFDKIKNFKKQSSLDSLKEKNKKRKLEKKTKQIFEKSSTEKIHTPRYDPMQPGFYPQSPAFHPKTPEYDPMQPGFYPQSPTFHPKTPEYDPMQPGFYPQSPAFHPKILEYDPERPEFHPQSPVFTPKTPEYNPAQPEFHPQSPVFTPKTPEYNPAQPEFHPQSLNFQSKTTEYNTIRQELELEDETSYNKQAPVEDITRNNKKNLKRKTLDSYKQVKTKKNKIKKNKIDNSNNFECSIKISENALMIGNPRENLTWGNGMYGNEKLKTLLMPVPTNLICDKSGEEQISIPETLKRKRKLSWVEDGNIDMDNETNVDEIMDNETNVDEIMDNETNVDEIMDNENKTYYEPEIFQLEKKEMEMCLYLAEKKRIKKEYGDLPIQEMLDQCIQMIKDLVSPAKKKKLVQYNFNRDLTIPFIEMLYIGALGVISNLIDKTLAGPWFGSFPLTNACISQIINFMHLFVSIKIIIKLETLQKKDMFNYDNINWNVLCVLTRVKIKKSRTLNFPLRCPHPFQSFTDNGVLVTEPLYREYIYNSDLPSFRNLKTTDAGKKKRKECSITCSICFQETPNITKKCSTCETLVLKPLNELLELLFCLPNTKIKIPKKNVGWISKYKKWHITHTVYNIKNIFSMPVNMGSIKNRLQGKNSQIRRNVLAPRYMAIRAKVAFDNRLTPDSCLLPFSFASVFSLPVSKIKVFNEKIGEEGWGTDIEEFRKNFIYLPDYGMGLMAKRDPAVNLCSLVPILYVSFSRIDEIRFSGGTMEKLNLDFDGDTIVLSLIKDLCVVRELLRTCYSKYNMVIPFQESRLVFSHTQNLYMYKRNIPPTMQMHEVFSFFKVYENLQYVKENLEVFCEWSTMTKPDECNFDEIEPTNRILSMFILFCAATKGSVFAFNMFNKISDKLHEISVNKKNDFSDPNLPSHYFLTSRENILFCKNLRASVLCGNFSIERILKMLKFVKTVESQEDSGKKTDHQELKKKLDLCLRKTTDNTHQTKNETSNIFNTKETDIGIANGWFSDKFIKKPNYLQMYQNSIPIIKQKAINAAKIPDNGHEILKLLLFASAYNMNGSLKFMDKLICKDVEKLLFPEQKITPQNALCFLITH